MVIAIYRTNMNNKIIQYKLENDSWEHVLDFSLNENIQFKKRIAGIAQNKLDETQLRIAEQLMNEVLEKDSMLQFLYSDIHNLNTLSDTALTDKWLLKHNDIRNDISAMEGEMARFRASFNKTMIQYF